MIQIRNGVFETNSSSTHSICIQKKPVDADYSYIVFNIGSYGWSEREVNFGDYLYTAILCLDPDGKSGYLSKLKSILDAHCIRYELEWPEWHESGKYKWLDNGYIDHYDETAPFVEAVLDDEDMLLRGLFGEDSVVYTGNDNEHWDEDCMCTVANEDFWYVDDDGNYKRVKVGNWDNPYYDPDNYDYFYKSN